MMAGVGVAHKLLKNNYKKKQKTTTNLWQSHLNKNYFSIKTMDEVTSLEKVA